MLISKTISISSLETNTSFPFRSLVTTTTIVWTHTTNKKIRATEIDGATIANTIDALVGNTIETNFEFYLLTVGWETSESENHYNHPL